MALSIHRAQKRPLLQKNVALTGEKNERSQTPYRDRHHGSFARGHYPCVIHAANIHDTVAGGAVFEKALNKYPSIKGVCADAGYRKTFESAVEALGRTVEISERIKPAGWQILPKRWRVERTFAWMNHSRRLSKDYEITTKSEESMVIISHIATLLKRF